MTCDENRLVFLFLCVLTCAVRCDPQVSARLYCYSYASFQDISPPFPNTLRLHRYTFKESILQTYKLHVLSHVSENTILYCS